MNDAAFIAAGSATAWKLLSIGFGFGAIAYLGVVMGRTVCKDIVPFEDGPARGDPPVFMLIALSAVLGAVLSRHGIVWPQLAAAAIMVAVLTAGWVSDVMCGILPDAFTLLPLAGLTVVRALAHQWDFLAAGILVFAPFAFIALCSKGIGMGWGDAKLAALGGVLVGASAALSVFIMASCIALVVAWIGGRKKKPIAFGPYLAGAIGVALAAGGPNI